MCGIVGAVANRNIVEILLDGLRRLEYRGYDSAGIAVVADHSLKRVRRTGKVSELSAALEAHPIEGNLGIAHTRWATHGVPAENNAHPHICNGRVAIVHNGIIENFEELKARQIKQGFRFTSDTDTEVMAHQIYHYLNEGNTLMDAVCKTVVDVKGAYALGVIDCKDPDTLVAARNGSPLVIGLGEGQNFIASDVQALIKETNRFIYLNNEDVACLTTDQVKIFDASGAAVQREEKAQLIVHAGRRQEWIRALHAQGNL